MRSSDEGREPTVHSALGACVNFLDAGDRSITSVVVSPCASSAQLTARRVPQNRWQSSATLELDSDQPAAGKSHASPDSASASAS